MAKGKRAKTVKAGSTSVIMVPSGGGVTRRRRSSGGIRRRSGKHHRRHNVSGASGGFFNSERIGGILGGFAMGHLDKVGTKLPTIPVLGRAGTVGVALYFAGKHMKMPVLIHGATAALAIAAYQLGNTGKVSGVEGDLDGNDTV